MVRSGSNVDNLCVGFLVTLCVLILTSFLEKGLAILPHSSQDSFTIFSFLPG